MKQQQQQAIQQWQKEAKHSSGSSRLYTTVGQLAYKTAEEDGSSVCLLQPGGSHHWITGGREEQGGLCIVLCEQWHSVENVWIVIGNVNMN